MTPQCPFTADLRAMRKSQIKSICYRPYSELSNKLRVFLILFEEIFPTPHFFTYTNEKEKSQPHDFSPTYKNGNNVPTPHLFQLHSQSNPFPLGFVTWYTIKVIKSTYPCPGWIGLNSRRNFTCLFREVPTLKTLINEQEGYVSSVFSLKRVSTRLLGTSEYVST